MAILLGNGRNGDVSGLEYCKWASQDAVGRFACAMFLPTGNPGEYGYWEYNELIEPAPGTKGAQNARMTIAEDWADAVAYSVYPEYGISEGHIAIGELRRNYVGVMMSLIP